MSALFSSLGFVIRNTPFLQRILFKLGGNRYRILYYHMVSENTPDYYFRNKGIRFDYFKEQIRYFRKWFTFIPLDEALDRLDKGLSLKGYMSVTTDDGFAENYTLIAPYLLKEKIPATFFLINECIDNRNLMWRNKLAYISNKLGESGTMKLMKEFAMQQKIPLPRRKDTLLSWSKRVFSMENKEKLTDLLWNKSNMDPLQQFLSERKPYMTVQQIRELSEQGFSFGAHTSTHPYCERLNYDQLESEISGSLMGIYEKTGIKVRFFSYPFGSRAKPVHEKRIIGEQGHVLKALIGIKSCLNNTDPYHWERDLVETSQNILAFRFFILPLVRKIFTFGNNHNSSES